MTQLHNAVLLDLMIHGPQPLADLEALARFANTLADQSIRLVIWQLANAITAGHETLCIAKRDAQRIKELHTARVDILAALVREGYALVEEVGATPGATIVMISSRGQTAAAEAFAPLVPLAG